MAKIKALNMSYSYINKNCNIKLVPNKIVLKLN